MAGRREEGSVLENFITVGAQVLVLFLLIGVGALLQKTKMMGDACVTGLTNIVLYFVTPCVIIEAFQRKYDSSMLRGLFATLVIAALSMLLSILLAKLSFHDPDPAKNKVYRFAVIYSNCGYMSLPLMQAILGSEGVFFGAMFIGMFNIILWTYGLYLMTGDRNAIRPVKLITNPGILGVFVGLIFFLTGVRLPEIVLRPISYLSSLNTPIPMFIIGYYLAKADLRSVWKQGYVYLACFLRLILVPVLCFGAMYLCGVRGVILTACTISISAPSAAATTMFATKFGGDRELSGSLVSVTTLFSLVTMPLLVAFSQMF